jgi:hypothetical protein
LRKTTARAKISAAHPKQARRTRRESFISVRRSWANTDACRVPASTRQSLSFAEGNDRTLASPARARRRVTASRSQTRSDRGMACALPVLRQTLLVSARCRARHEAFAVARAPGERPAFAKSPASA